ncbi:12-oxophytodienoate reductase [Sphingopyxis sp.]|uniref:oxidoreductase n=1 Tax=Sphingopyxis sp. TaxID=1908224 RepID=UPI001DD3B250|nr:12-oxophytodienoate reductase [Sphingopyxis sp.]MBW8297350.1 12-oxophytodienoate reductase [Sphingopyxis sp.]
MTTAPLDDLAALLAPLHAPFTCKSLKAPNRFCMAPMSRYFAPGGVLRSEGAEYYRRRAAAGIGTIITEGTGVAIDHTVSADTVPIFAGAEPLAAWKDAVNAVHAEGGMFVPQLWHVGGCADFNYPDSPHAPLVSPSGFAGPDVPGGRAMTDRDIADTAAAFAESARAAKAIGCDAIELHGAHGYIFDQFFWDKTNLRSDRYGGPDIGDRATFAAEVVAACRAAVGEDFAIIFRVSQWKTYDYDVKLARDPDEMHRWLDPLVRAGVDIFHASQRRFWEPEYAGNPKNLGGWIKEVTGKPVITVGSIGMDRDLMQDFVEGISSPMLGRLEDLAEMFERGEFDLVALGRVLLADPEWLEKVEQRRIDELTPYDRATALKQYEHD